MADTPSATALQSELEKSLTEYVSIRQARVICEKQLEGLAGPLKSWLGQHEGEDLYDGEHGIRAYLQPRRGAPPYDLVSMWERDPSLFKQLLMHGCLRVDQTAVERAGALVAGAKRYAGPEPVAYALQVKEE